MELKDFLPLIGVVVGAGVAVWLQKRKERMAREHLAVVVVAVLDKYLEEAAAVVMDDGEPDPDDRYHSKSPVAALPTFTTEDIKVEWSSLAPTLIHRILDLAPRTAHAKEVIEFEAEQAGPPDYSEVFEERQFQFAKLGLIAAKLADDLRPLAKLPPYRPRGNWNPIELMRRKQMELVERRRKREERERLNPDM